MTLSPERIPHGAKTALVLLQDPAWLAAVRNFLEQGGHYLLHAADPAQAQETLRLNPVDVAVVYAVEQNGPVASRLVSRPGLVRRKTCLIFVGPFVSLDEFAAFRLGADWVLSQNDLAQADTLLTDILARQEDRRAPWLAAGGLVDP